MIDRTDDGRAEMLVLAALSYRGFSDILRGNLHERGVGARIESGLAALAPVRGRWDLASQNTRATWTISTHRPAC